ncbi:MAG: AAA family ATPase [Kangiellaceae bacterium]
MENYISLQKSQLLDSLENQVRFSQLVAVLVGEKGIGKSFTLDQLQERLANEVHIAQIDAAMEIEETQLQKVICLQLGLPSGPQDNFEYIEQSIRTNLRKKALISIDNAHLLSNKSLNSLLGLNQNQINHQESVLFLLLSGDESLPKNISFTNTFKKHQEMCVVFQLEAIEKSEVAPMVSSLSHLSLDEVEEAYGTKQLDYFWQLSKGIPAELEYQVSRWQSDLVEEKVDLQQTEVAETSYWKSLVYLVLGVTFASILFYQDEINQLITPDEISDHKVDSESLNPTAREVKKETLNTGTIEKRKTKQANQNTGEHLVKKEGIEENINTLREATVEREDSQSRKSTGQIIKKPKKKEKVVEQKVSDHVPSVADLKVEPTKVVNSETTKQPDIKRVSLSIDEELLLEQPNSYFSLQWVGVSQLEKAQDYRTAHPLKDKMYIYRRRQASGYLYLVVSDLFVGRIEANEAKERYKNLKYKGNPWIKSIAAIKTEISNL